MKKAFTLIELLVVIAIIAILAAILFPVFAQAKESARISTGISDAKQLGLAFQTYMADHDDVLPLGGIISRNIDQRSVGASEWQEAIYPYVKNEGVYRLPSDATAYVKDVPNCATAVSLRTTQYSAVSFLTNFNITVPKMENGQQSRTSWSLSSYTQPASFILLMNGQRPIIAGGGTGQRYNADPKDHNGMICSLWLGIYSQTNDGGAKHILNPLREDGGKGIPHHKNGVIFAFLDGHVKFVPIKTDDENAHRSLEGRYPWCKHGRVNADDPTCTQTWNLTDEF